MCSTAFFTFDKVNLIGVLQGDKSSRAQILRKASEYITHMRGKQSKNEQDCEDLR